MGQGPERRTGQKPLRGRYLSFLLSSQTIHTTMGNPSSLHFIPASGSTSTLINWTYVLEASIVLLPRTSVERIDPPVLTVMGRADTIQVLPKMAPCKSHNCIGKT